MSRARVLGDDVSSGSGISTTKSIPPAEVFSRKDPVAISPLANEYLNFLTYPQGGNIKESKSVIFGSYNLKVQPYPSDIDYKNFIKYIGDANVCIDNAIKIFVDKVHKIINTHGWYFTDAKAGFYDDGEAVHWTANEILQGHRNGDIEDFNGHKGDMTLAKAFRQYSPNAKNLIKIDMVVPYYKGYIECSMVYVFMINGKYINYRDEDFSLASNLKGLRTDALKQEKNNKLLKVVKRIFSQARAINDVNTGQLLEPLLRSDVSKLGAIKSDIDTLELLFHTKNIPQPAVFYLQLQIIRDNIGSIYNIDVEEIDELIDHSIKAYVLKDYDRTAKLLNILSKTLNAYINTGVTTYLQSHGWYSFPKQYVGGGIVSYVKNVLFNKEATTLTKYLKEYGDYQVVKIIVLRNPVQKGYVTAVKILNLGKEPPYETLYHLFAILVMVKGSHVVQLQIEKEPNIIVKEVNELPQHDSKVESNVMPPVQFSKLIENTKKYYSSNDFFEYDARDNNCQRFIKSICHAVNITKLDNFIEQDVSSILQGHTHFIARKVTDVQHIVNRLRGKGYKDSHIYDLLHNFHRLGHPY
jgi:hypothetical protein